MPPETQCQARFLVSQDDYETCTEQSVITLSRGRRCLRCVKAILNRSHPDEKLWWQRYDDVRLCEGVVNSKPETLAAEKVETPEHIADKIWSDWQDAVRTNFLSVANPRIAIAQALTSARFAARRECERELAALGLTVAFQDQGVAELTFAECKEGHILDRSGAVRKGHPLMQWHGDEFDNNVVVGIAFDNYVPSYPVFLSQESLDAKEAK